MKRNDGFTLVELLCAIVAGSIVTAATATILLLGLRLNANANEMATQDNQAMICLTVMENMIKSKKVDSVVADKVIVKIDDSNSEALFTYYELDKKIVASSGAVLLEGVDGCEFLLENGLLTIKLTLKETPFIKTICPRTGEMIKIS